MVFNKIPYFLQLFAENLMKTLKYGSLVEKLLVLSKSTIFYGFWENQTRLATFCKSLDKNPKPWLFVRKVARSGQIDGFLWFLTKSNTVCHNLQFLEMNGIQNLTSAPYHPRTNSLAERFIRPKREALKNDKGNSSLRYKVDTFLMKYHNCPHTAKRVIL